MSERKLPSRRRKFTKGRAIRVSDLVFKTLEASRRQRGLPEARIRSWDATMRRMLGLPDRTGRTQPLVEGMLEVTTGVFLLKLEGTSWPELEETAFKLATKIAEKKKMVKIAPPIRMRECL